MKPTNTTGELVLIVEDDESLHPLLRAILAKERYQVVICPSMFLARGAIAKALPDLVILDRQLPDGDGLEFCKELRGDRRTRPVPIILLTTKKAARERIEGLEEGADDYLAKPFVPAELLLRVKAILRRTRPADEPRAVFEAGPLKVDAQARRVFLGKREVELRPKEFDLLVALVEGAGRALSRQFLLERAWGLDKELELTTNVVDVTVANLRRKLGRHGSCIVSVHSVGFRFDAERP